MYGSGVVQNASKSAVNSPTNMSRRNPSDLCLVYTKIISLVTVKTIYVELYKVFLKWLHTYNKIGTSIRVKIK
jgi:hypothetical protein